MRFGESSCAALTALKRGQKGGIERKREVKRGFGTRLEGSGQNAAREEPDG